jgi:lipid II:glycine glycyltransferase (peptidoglycan interpeptide bridge formation enzyme)
MYVEAAGIVHLHLGGSDPRFERAHPSKLLYHRTRLWAKDRGDTWMHLGGGRGADDDSLLHFKAGFGGDRMPYRTLRLVVDEDGYRALLAARFPEGVPESAAGFFPAYRAP